MTKIFTIPFAETGDKSSPPNSTQPDGTVSYAQGFGFDYQRKTDGSDPLSKVFPREGFNGIINDITAAVGEIQINGLAIWQDLIPKISYPVGSMVRYNNKNWVSLAANNTATPQEGAFWTEAIVNTYSKVQIDSKLALKADKSTTLAGYGIVDAYTKLQVDAALNEKITPAAVNALLTSWFPKRSFSTSDFVRIPDVPGGLIIQIQRIVHTAGKNINQTFTFPTQFPNSRLAITALDNSSLSARPVIWSTNEQDNTLSSFVMHWTFGDVNSSNASRSAFIVSFGY